MAIRIVSNQIADAAIATAKIAGAAVTPAKAALDQGWAFTALPTVNADPSSSNDLVRKNYVDGLLQGLTWKSSCVVKVGSNVNTSSPGAALDGITLSNDDRVMEVEGFTDSGNMQTGSTFQNKSNSIRNEADPHGWGGTE